MDNLQIKELVFNEIKKKQLIVIPIGITVIFGIVFSLTAIFPNIPQIAIITGFVLVGTVFGVTRNIIYPLVISIFYNLIVVAIRSEFTIVDVLMWGLQVLFIIAIANFIFYLIKMLTKDDSNRTYIISSIIAGLIAGILAILPIF